ncbi:MAG: hypothetical protein ACLP1X_05000 [Polyangiaceae bacterium]
MPYPFRTDLARDKFGRIAIRFRAFETVDGRERESARYEFGAHHSGSDAQFIAEFVKERTERKYDSSARIPNEVDVRQLYTSGLNTMVESKRQVAEFDAELERRAMLKRAQRLAPMPQPYWCDACQAYYHH